MVPWRRLLRWLPLLVCTGACGRPPLFPRSVFWQPIPSDAAVDEGSAGYIADLQRQSHDGGRLNINLSAYNVAVYPVDGSVAMAPLRLAQTTPQSPSAVPLPSGAEPARGGDGHLVVVDADLGQSYELWQAVPPSGGRGWSASAAITFDTNGDGVNQAGTGVRATSLSLLSGLIGYDEVRGGGPITHALAWAFDHPSSLYLTAPAVTSDGNVSGGRPTAIPAGARLQLDPALDLDTLDLSPAARRLAEALQRYGMICVDSSGDSSLVAEALHDGQSWTGLLSEDALRPIPISRLRVLKMDKVGIR